jgi:hypothetical protein
MNQPLCTFTKWHQCSAKYVIKTFRWFLFLLWLNNFIPKVKVLSWSTWTPPFLLCLFCPPSINTFPLVHRASRPMETTRRPCRAGALNRKAPILLAYSTQPISRVLNSLPFNIIFFTWEKGADIGKFSFHSFEYDTVQGFIHLIKKNFWEKCLGDSLATQQIPQVSLHHPIHLQ